MHSQYVYMHTGMVGSALIGLPKLGNNTPPDLLHWHHQQRLQCIRFHPTKTTSCAFRDGGISTGWVARIWTPYTTKLPTLTASAPPWLCTHATLDITDIQGLLTVNWTERSSWSTMCLKSAKGEHAYPSTACLWWTTCTMMTTIMKTTICTIIILTEIGYQSTPFAAEATMHGHFSSSFFSPFFTCFLFFIFLSWTLVSVPFFRWSLQCLWLSQNWGPTLWPCECSSTVWFYVQYMCQYICIEHSIACLA